jgi:hypothetical protein
MASTSAPSRPDGHGTASSRPGSARPGEGRVCGGTRRRGGARGARSCQLCCICRSCAQSGLLVSVPKAGTPCKHPRPDPLTAQSKSFPSKLGFSRAGVTIIRPLFTPPALTSGASPAIPSVCSRRRVATPSDNLSSNSRCGRFGTKGQARIKPSWEDIAISKQ